jgi:hypothetical protein
MMKLSLPEGMTEEDYGAIEDAVMETVRGRWFLAEFARRSHIAEMRQMLDAVARLEHVVTTNQVTAPADPSIRLLVSRLKEVSQRLGGTVEEMRTAGVEEEYCEDIETQARALAGLLRLNNAPEPVKRPPALLQPAPLKEAPPAPSPAAAPPASPAPLSTPLKAPARSFDERLAALGAIDSLPTIEKLRLFS